ncbi:hypothetical protein [uncultured Roseibium sp.]|uniref:hypothetical protein n=1 Tax=uncultured Roseibium sp. TaxID=1936171 RepID=UPI0032165B12
MNKAMRIGALGLLVAGLGGGLARAEQVDPALEQAIRNRAAYVLNDPYSAVFTFDIVEKMNDGAVGKICGTVNAKNGFGAYAGKQFFFAGYVHQGDAYQIFAFEVPGYSLEQAVAHGGICD